MWLMITNLLNESLVVRANTDEETSEWNESFTNCRAEVLEREAFSKGNRHITDMSMI
jgi:hypothetical protein